jgi:hypothetical protein
LIVVFRLDELLVLIVLIVLTSTLTFRGMQIIHRHDYRRYGRAVIWIAISVVCVTIALLMIYGIGFGFVQFLK